MNPSEWERRCRESQGRSLARRQYVQPGLFPSARSLAVAVALIAAGYVVIFAACILAEVA